MSVIGTNRSVELAGSTPSRSKGAVSSSLRAVQRPVLAELLTSYPYNSASQLREYFGDGPLPSSYGGSCAWQSFEAGRSVAERSGAEAEYRIDGRHVAAVYRDADGITILDPYLMHCLPLRLERADAVDGDIEGALLKAAELHRVAAPAGLGLAEYSLEDE